MSSRRRSAAGPAIGLGATGLFAWWVTGLPPFSISTTLAVVVTGLAVALLSGRGDRRPVQSPGPVGLAVWAVLVTGLAAWQIAALVELPRSDHPTLSSLANAALDARPVRAVAFAAWLAASAWLGRR
jgi:hypothetical protein